VSPFEHAASNRRSRKSNQFLIFDQTFEATLGEIEPEWSWPMVIFFKRLIKDASGVTAIEYGLLAALVVVGSLVSIQLTGINLNLQGTFGKVATNLK
jgi:pilus assembly protein Flp/PilA